jgi:hypothetical protein
MKHPPILISAMLLAGLASVAAGTKPASVVPDLAKTSMGIGGTGSGLWNLPIPSEGEDGYASGTLDLGGSFPFYLMSVVLPAGSVDGTGTRSAGSFHGTLHCFPLSPISPPSALVSGTWQATGPDGGTFSGVIHTGGGPLGLQAIQIGTIGGTFSDLTVFGGSGTPEVLGSWDAKWNFFRLF